MSTKRKYPDGQYVFYSDLQIKFKNSEIEYLVDWNTLINYSGYFDALKDCENKKNIELDEDSIIFKEMLNLIYYPYDVENDIFSNNIDIHVILQNCEKFVMLLNKYQIIDVICNNISIIIIHKIRDNKINTLPNIVNFCFKFSNDANKKELFNSILPKIKNKSLDITQLNRGVIKFLTDTLLTRW